MKRCVHTILCWLLTVSLTGLPLAVSAEATLSLLKSESCLEMNSDTQKPAVMSEHDADEPMVSTACCDCCNDGCMCEETSACNARTSQVSPFIVIDQYFIQSTELAQFAIEQFVQYLSQSSSPDFRPPIV